MTARPILMSDPMVQAILAGRKTQTRRVIKPQPTPATTHPGCVPWVGKLSALDYAITWCTPTGDGGIYKDGDKHSPYRCPYGQPGDFLWVREMWLESPDGISYRADPGAETEYGPGDGPRWRPSIHMRREHSRLTLRITDVRVERLARISDAECRAEGIQRYVVSGSGPDGRSYQDWRTLFKQLWDSINAKRGYSWESKPWVWVIEFDAIRANVDDIAAAQEVGGERETRHE